VPVLNEAGGAAEASGVEMTIAHEEAVTSAQAVLALESLSLSKLRQPLSKGTTRCKLYRMVKSFEYCRFMEQPVRTGITPGTEI
jgi:hypothetical protein